MRFWVLVVPLDEGADVLLELRGGGVDAALELLAGEFGDRALYLVDPRCPGWREVDMIVPSARESCPRQRGFVGCVVIHDGVDVEVGGHLSIDLLEDIEKLSSAALLVAFANHEARGNVERGKQRGRTVSNIAMGAARTPQRIRRLYSVFCGP